MDSNHGEEFPRVDGGDVGAPGNAVSGGVITARGTGDGVVLRIDGRVEGLQLRAVLRDFMRSRRSFLTGNEVALEWIGQEPEQSIVDSLSRVLADEFGISVSSSKLREPGGDRSRDGEMSSTQPDLSMNGSLADSVERGPIIERRNAGLSSRARGASLFGGLEYLAMDESSATPQQPARAPTGRGFDPSQAMWDDPDARILYTTLRSGQKIESEHSIIICGDINSGAEVVAGGDIIVLGTLRGVAHAGAYDETGGGRFIFALNLQPTQLRIGSTISRGASTQVARGSGSRSAGEARGSVDRAIPVENLAEIARVDGAMIVVEPYQSRTFLTRK